MPESKAVFLSYASDDASAAQRIADALREAGVTVWFDKDELRGGDAWDASIRRQIRECALFVPIISSITEAREEGYFRREWNLASDRTLDMGQNRAFIVPVVIDDTHQKKANVPDKFRSVQWTRLPEGNATTAFAAHVQRLLGSGAQEQPRLKPAIPGATTFINAPRRKSILFYTGFGLGCLAIIGGGWYLVHGERPETTAGPTAPEKSIAVLPFVDMSEHKDQEYFADGMAEELLDLLAKIPQLRVIARGSSFSFKGKPDDIPTIGRKLNVNNILEGSVRKAGTRLRVTTQLVRAATGEQIWSETYDRELKDVFKIQDEIANAIAHILQIHVLGGPLTRQSGGTQDLEAYQLYLRAISLRERNTIAAKREASQYLEKAISLDPDFGLAWYEFAVNAQNQADLVSVPPETGYEDARQRALHALKLSPDLIDAHTILQYVYWVHDHDWDSSEREGNLVLGKDPTNPDALMFAGMRECTLGHWDEAIRHLRGSLVRNPQASFPKYNLGQCLYNAGLYAEAENALRTLIQDDPTFIWAHAYLGKTMLSLGKPEDALTLVRQEPDEQTRLDYLSIALLAVGQRAAADQVLEDLEKRYGATSAYHVAMTYAYRNDHELALQWLDRAYRQNDTDLVEIVGEPLLRNLADDPRFKAFLRKMHLPG